MSKIAILQCADTGPLESLVVMLRSVGYECLLPDNALKGTLRHLGCDTVLDVDGLVENWGYERPMHLPSADASVMKRADLYVDVKAHRNGPRIWRYWPNLRNKTLWYRINGGKPEWVINASGDHGDELSPPCPTLTPNQWYKEHPNGYCCWPPFVGVGRYLSPREVREPPVCLIHNLHGWGYGKLERPFRYMRIKFYGRGSPDGLLPHQVVPKLLSRTLCMVHLKSSDAPGYALYEALAAACPIICTRRLIWRCRMQDLLIPGETCLVFDRETHEGLSDMDVAECTREVAGHLEFLRDPERNRAIGEAGRRRLHEVMWSDKKESDVQSFRQFMTRHFG